MTRGTLAVALDGETDAGWVVEAALAAPPSTASTAKPGPGSAGAASSSCVPSSDTATDPSPASDSRPAGSACKHTGG